MNSVYDRRCPTATLGKCFRMSGTTIGREPIALGHHLTSSSVAVLCLFFLCNVQALSLRGKPSTQSSTMSWGKALSSDLATDGNLDTNIYNNAACTHTLAEVHPWWMLDLEGIYSISKIILVNRGDCCSHRLTNAVVRVGSNSDITANTACGSPVTAEQAGHLGGRVVIECSPVQAGRYISVDIDRRILGGRVELSLCEVMVEEYVADVLLTNEPTEMGPFSVADRPSVTCIEFTLIQLGKSISNSYPLANVSTGSAVRCTMECIWNDQCTSFDFVPTTDRCRLFGERSLTFERGDGNGHRCSVFTVA